MKRTKEEISFRAFIQLVGITEMERVLSGVYADLNRSFGQTIRLGEDAYSFCATVLYTFFDPTYKSLFSQALADVWTGEIPVSQLNIYIEGILRRKNKALYQWKEAKQWLVQHATWIEMHDMRIDAHSDSSFHDSIGSDDALLLFTFPYAYNKKQWEKVRSDWLLSMRNRYMYAHNRRAWEFLAPHWFPTSIACPNCSDTLFDLILDEQTPLVVQLDRVPNFEIRQLFTCVTCETLFSFVDHPLLHSNWLFHEMHTHEDYTNAVRTLSMHYAKRGLDPK